MQPHVLVIEDEVRMARLLELELHDAGYQVSVALDGLLGWQQATTLAPDVIVLDWLLPQLTGLEICTRLRQGGSRTPIIFTTALSDRTHQEQAEQAGATAYIVKPFTFEHLLQAISVPAAMQA